ncbi:MAG TPA: PSD1 and planctomycete cytochrome C domain-containing protein [Verrucomicrobiae bacterium]
MRVWTKFVMCLSIAGWSAGLSLSAAEFTAEQLDFFEKKVRPVLVESCFECHSVSAAKVKGGLYLDSREAVLNGGDAGKVVVPESPEKSLLIKAVEYSDPELQMPPKTRLTSAQVEDLKQWVRLGLPWPQEAAPKAAGKVEVFDLEARKQAHWAWQAIKKPTLPTVKDAQWGQLPIDRLILAKLEAEGLKPAPAAEKRTLVRRLYFDLLGLPPTPEQVEAFVAHKSPKAVEKLVDELLASPHFGERWGRHWLDMMRYAETMGHEFDYPIHNAWRYRDYVIRAFNADVPYNQFVKEHLAGDLLKQPRINPADGFNESVIGTTAFWLSQQVHSPVDVRLHQAELIDNQIDVISKTFLGMTVSCARCHDHKFDAISDEDYYSLYGIIESSRYRLAEVEPLTTTLEQAKRLQGIKQQIKARLKETTVTADWKVKEYLLAVNEVLSGKVPADVKAKESGDVVLADFEWSGFGKWVVIGDAFGEGPVAQKEIGTYQGDVGAVGKGFINSHNARREGKVIQSDSFTGKLTGPEFTITRNHIHFLVGGGAHAGKTCVNLILEGKVVRSVTGKESNRMSAAKFEVSEFQGKTARIEVVDDVKGSWGNIGLDHVVMSDRTEFFGADNQPLLQADLVGVVAKARGLDAKVLKRWIAVQTGKEKVQLPGDHSSLLQVDKALWIIPPVDVQFAFARNQVPTGWSANGAAFEIRATAQDNFRVGTVEQPVKYVEDRGVLASGQVSPRLEGTLQSPAFTIEKDFIHLLIAGTGSRVSLVVDGFTLIRNPIYGNLRQTLNSEAPKWYRMDVRMWKGHRAFLEFVDRSPADSAAGGGQVNDWFAVEQVFFSNSADAPVPMPQVKGTEENGMETVAKEINDLVMHWLEGRTTFLKGQRRINQLLSNQLITLGKRDDAELKGLLEEYAKVEAGIRELVTVPALTEGTPYDEKVFLRGSPRRLGEVVKRRNLEALGGEVSAIYEEGSGRMQLAEDWTSQGNPLLARVLVNKVWHHLMGRGIVPTVDNFGVLGQVPSHPELLDWLAEDFRTTGDWSVKRLIKQVVLSRTYQMASQPNDAAAEAKDPNNEWWHRMNVKRLEGEAIRDAVLAVSGSLDRKMFGPSVAIHLTEFMDGRGRPGKSGPLDGDGRRSIYTEVRRNFLSPMMLAFDAPNAATTVGRRTVSNVPAQALILMNDPFVVQQAKVWAERLLKEEMSAEARVEKIYRRAFGRGATVEELKRAMEFLRVQAGEYGVSGEAGLKDVRVWADLCHVVFNVKEFVFNN